MIPNATSVFEVTGNFTRPQMPLEVDLDAMPHIVSVLTNVYGDRELAPIREYSTNARDAQVEAGRGHLPINVTLPGPFSDQLIIEDTGTGMSLDDLDNTYRKYGRSTKRTNREATGTLGIGGKSALTYADQFIVRSRHNGLEILARIGRNPDGSAGIDILDTLPTEEVNGVQITIPVKPGNRIAEKAREFFKYWPKGTVLIDGKEPEHVEGKEVTPGIFLVNGTGTDKIVMGNIAYPVEDGLYGGSNYYKAYHVIAFVPMNSIDFAPNREMLSNTPLTDQTIEQINKKITEELPKFVERDISTAATFEDALKSYQFWGGVLGYSVPKGITYKGHVIPDQLSKSHNHHVFNISAYRHAVQFLDRFGTKQLDEALFVYNYHADSIPSYKKAKIKEYLKTHPYHYVICGPDVPDSPWTDHCDRVDWSVISAIKVNPSTSSGRRGWAVEGYECYVDGEYQVIQSDELDDTKPIFYFGPREEWVSELDLTDRGIPGTIVRLGTNRWDKLKRLYPEAKHIKQGAKEVYLSKLNALTDDDLRAMNCEIHPLASYLDADRIDDPEVQEYLRIVKTDVERSRINEYNLWRNIMNRVDYSFLNANQPRKVARTTAKSLNKYKLLEHYSYRIPSSHMDDLMLYMNAKYQANSLDERKESE